MNDIIEECYSMQIGGNGKLDSETNKIIDDAVALFNDLLSRMNSAKSIKEKGEQKKLYDSINSDLEANSLKLMGRMNKI